MSRQPATPAEFRAFELRVAAGAGESELFREAASLFRHDAATGELARAFAGSGAFADAAILLYRRALPEWGFQFGEPPRLPDGRAARAVATLWRRGTGPAIPYQAATPALALLRATAAEAARRFETHELDACPVCRGIGWFVTAENRKQMCRHGRAAEF
jgi:hypothetical protein